MRLHRGPSALAGIALVCAGLSGPTASHLALAESGSQDPSSQALLVAIGTVLLLAAGTWILTRARRSIALVARPSGQGGTDLWIGGAASRRSPAIEAEFDALVEEARRLHAEFRRANHSRPSHAA